MSGIDTAAPFRVTLIAAALFANLAASSIDIPSTSPAQNPPIQQSPAPVVSTLLTLTAGIMLPLTLLPRSPSVSMIYTVDGISTFFS